MILSALVLVGILSMTILRVFSDSMLPPGRPITPPGEVYASRAFASLARSEGVQSFICAYVGQTPLAKGYGTFPTYVVHRRFAGAERSSPDIV